MNFNEEHTAILEAAFQVIPYPDTTEALELSKQTKDTEKHVQVRILTEIKMISG